MNPTPSLSSQNGVLDFPSMQLGRRRKRPNRSQNAITLSILEACRTPCLQHWLMIKARLGYNSFVSHVDSLIDEGMIKVMNERNRVFYSITQQGLVFYDRLKENLSEEEF